MKHFLSLLGIMLAMCSAHAQYVKQPKTYSNKFFKAISPNGKHAASSDEYIGTIYVVNLATNSGKTYSPQDEENEFYSIGSGANPVSDNGIVLFSENESGTASYIENGKIYKLPLPAGVSSALCNAITPDGSRIAGSIGIAATDDAQDVMQRPVIWNRRFDGSYTMPVELPYPKEDFTGRLPQYVLADGISADGKTIACNVVDYYGEMPQPMILREQEDGEWTYTMLAQEYINPDNVVFPEYPGESPYPGNYMTPAEADAYNQAAWEATQLKQPRPNDFMSPEKREEYEEATSGYGNPVNYRDYMSDAEYAEYMAALDKYYASLYPKPEDFMYPDHREAYLHDMEQWEKLYDQFADLLKEVQSKAVTFVMNELMISQNGRYYTIGGSTTDPATKASVMKVYVFDLETGKSYVKGVDDANIFAPRYITNEGKILASSFPTRSDKKANTYFCAGLNEDFVPLQDIASKNDADVYDFMQKNMLHNMWVWDDDIEEDVEINAWITGVGCCDANLKTVFTWATTDSWDSSSSSTTYSLSYALPTSFLNEFSNAIKNTEGGSNAIDITMTADGMIKLSGKVAEVSIYDLSGRLVFSEKNPKPTISTSLPRGSYIVKAANGTEKKVAKLLFND